MERYLVTGAAGNLARQLVDALVERNCEVMCVDLALPGAGQLPAAARLEQADICDAARMTQLIGAFAPQCILHMASLLSSSSEADPPRAWQVNATASVQLLELALSHGVQRFFYPSTSATYAAPLPDPLPEDFPQWPDNIYGVTKVAVERAGTYFAGRRGLDFRSVRLPIVISPYAPEAAVSAYASQAFVAAAAGTPFSFPVSAELSASTIYVRDVTAGILQLVAADAERLTRRVYNLHSFAPTARDLAHAIGERAPGFDFRFEPQALAMEILGPLPARHDDSSARDDWGWQPRYDLAATADDMLARLPPSHG